jgi:hypothetical protein
MDMDIDIDINTDFSSYKIININPECFKTITSYPCYHRVDIMLNKNEIIKNSVLSSAVIVEYYKYYNMNIPYHFSENKYRN